MSTRSSNSSKLTGPYIPTLILHGGAGSYTRGVLPPLYYEQYEKSLLSYVNSTRGLLFNGENALTAAVHAVSCMEDDFLFNCGRGSVFTEKGTIEMEASVMIASVRPDAATSATEGNGGIPTHAYQKRAAGVIGIKQTRHPIQLAQQVLLHTQEEVGGASRHVQLAGPEIEETGFNEWGLEKKSLKYFFTQRRWEEHVRGLKKAGIECNENPAIDEDDLDDDIPDEIDLPEGLDIPSQGTVGCVCMDQWGNVVTATSTGGLTNKKAGRVGDTPTIGAGFWAESWDETPSITLSQVTRGPSRTENFGHELYETFRADLRNITSCIPFAGSILGFNKPYQPISLPESEPLHEKSSMTYTPPPQSLHAPAPASTTVATKPQRRAIAISGTGNGDSFLRIAAARTVGAFTRFQGKPLNVALPLVSGPHGELEESAGDRFSKGEGQGGMIGIEVVSPPAGLEQMGAGKLKGEVVLDFNCGGMWRAYWDEEEDQGKVMIFKEEY